MSAWLQQALERSQANQDWLTPSRNRALAALQSTPWPSRRTEGWKYTSLSALEQLSAEAPAEQPVSEIPAIEGLDCLELVFLNGQLQSDLSTLQLPAGVRIDSMASLPPEQQVLATTQFANIKPERHLFGLVNDVLAQDIVFIQLDDGCHLPQPIRIVHQSTEGQQNHQRVLVRLGHKAKASLIEQFLGNQSSVTTAFTELDLAEDAELDHYRLALQSGQALHFGGCHFCLHHRAQLNSTLIGYGSALSRTDIDIIHNGEHAHAKLNAIYLLAESEHFDLHSTIEHAKPNGTTEENVRGIVGDKANAVFNGRIHIHRDAQKTLAELNNRNLLLSRRGQINTKPELEIYADDVQCAHGATVAEIEEQALYYLRSRGISRSQALIMLNFGFIQELVNQMPNQQLAAWLQPQLRARFKEMEVQ